MKKRSLISVFFLILAIVTFNGCGDNSAEFSPRLNAPLASQEAGQKKCKPLIGVFVDNQNASGASDGKSWASAYTSISAAVDALPKNGGKVYVAAGTYEEGLEIKDKKNISIIGGYKSTDLCEKALKDIDEADWFILIPPLYNDPVEPDPHQINIIKSSENISFRGIKFVRNDYDSAVLIEGDDNTTSVKKISFTNVSFESGSDKKFGGGIEAKNMTGLFLNQVTFNELKTYDGCLAIADSEDITVTNSIFSKCSSNKRGGSIAIKNSSKINLLSLGISHSTSAKKGGGIAIMNTQNVKFNGVSFDKNSLTAVNGKGGALFFSKVTDAHIDLSGKNITGNIVESAGEGGAFYIAKSKNINFKGGTFADNGKEDNKPQLGGAFYITETENLSLENLHLENNHAQYGGAAFLENISGNITLTNNKFYRNKAQLGGAAIFNDIKNNMLLNKCIFEENESEANGGALLVGNTNIQIEIRDSLFVANKAKSYGGALVIDAVSSTPQIATTNATKFERNASEQDDGGGAIFLAIPEITGVKSPHAYLVLVSDFAFIQNTTKNGQGEALRIVSHAINETDVDVSTWIDESFDLLKSYVNLGASKLTYNPGIDQKSIVFKKQP